MVTIESSFMFTYEEIFVTKKQKFYIDDNEWKDVNTSFIISEMSFLN